jgi:hypothetical protein
VNDNPFPSNAPFNTTGFANMPSNFGTQYDIFKRKSFNGDLSYFAIGKAVMLSNLVIPGSANGMAYQKQQIRLSSRSFGDRLISR